MSEEYKYHRSAADDYSVEHLLSFIDYMLDGDWSSFYSKEDVLRGQKAINEMEEKLAKIKDTLTHATAKDSVILDYIRSVVYD